MFSVSHYFLHDKLWKAKISKTIHLQVSVMHIKSHSGAASESYLWSVWLNGSFQHHWCSDQISTWNKRMVVSFIKKYIFFLLSSGNVVMFLQSTRCVSSLLYQMTILHTNPPTIEKKSCVNDTRQRGWRNTWNTHPIIALTMHGLFIISVCQTRRIMQVVPAIPLLL